MKRALRLILLLGALVGLFGEAAANASGPLAMPQPGAMSGMSADCLKMMAHQQPAQHSDKRPGPDCCTAAGCVVPIIPAVLAPMPVSVAPLRLAAFWRNAAVLRGSELTPEPEPPALLG